MSRIRTGLLAVGLLVILSGCVAAGPSASATTTIAPEPTRSLEPASQQPVEVPVSSATPVAGSGEVPAAIIEAVKAEIASDAGVDARDVTIISAEAMTFPDGSLGCPSPGVVYIQVLVDGFKVVGTASGATFDYRGTSATDLTRCEKPR